MAGKEKVKTTIIAHRIKDLRQKEKLTQAQLGEKLFKSESTVRMWELGKSEPDIDTLNILASVFNVSTDYLIGRTDELTSHKQSIIYEGIAMSFAKRLREAMSIRNMGALDLIEKIVKYSVKDEDRMDAQDIGSFADARFSLFEDSGYITLTLGKIENIAKALNIATDQLLGDKEITNENRRPYNPGLEGEAFLYYAAARSLEFHPDGPIRKPKEKWQDIYNAPDTDDTFE